MFDIVFSNKFIQEVPLERVHLYIGSEWMNKRVDDQHTFFPQKFRCRFYESRMG